MKIYTSNPNFFASSIRNIKALIRAVEKFVLRNLFPSGKFVRLNQTAMVFVDFSQDSYRWYKGNSEFLRQEHAAFTKLMQGLKPNTVLDIGAHWGVFPALLDTTKPLYPSLRSVLCVEPDPKNIPILRRTIDRIKSFDVDLIQAAISDKSGPIDAHYDGGSCLETYNIPTSSASKFTVNGYTLCDCLNAANVKYSTVSHIKLDIDGYEPALIMGNHDFLAKMDFVMMSEFWPRGLLTNGSQFLQKYWDHLVTHYSVYLCVYPSGDIIRLSADQLEWLVDYTGNRVVNLLLIPNWSSFDSTCLA